MVALGVIMLIRGGFLWTWAGVPEGVPSIVAYLNGVVMVAAGVGLYSDRTVRVSALVLAGIWAIYALCHVPAFVDAWKPNLIGLAEPSGLACCFAVLAGESSRGNDQLAMAGRYGFGVCLLLYGIVHYLWHDFVADFIPSWMPARLFFAYATGAAFVAAGLSVLSGQLIRLGTLLLAVMFTLWVVLLHIPRGIAAPAAESLHEWGGTFVACAFMGAAWMFSASRVVRSARSRERATS